MIRIVHRLDPGRWRVRLGLGWLDGSAVLLAAGIFSNVLGDEFHVQNWRLEDGLPDGQITAITQTPDGYLWIGTARGLARFDGIRFKTFDAKDTRGFTDSRISSLTTDQAGTLWVGMMDGNIARRGEDGFAEVQPAVPLKLRPDQNRIPDTWLWNRRTAMVEEAEGTPRSNVENVSDRWAQLITDGAGAVWWHVTDLGLMRFQAGQWSVFTPTNGLPPVTIREAACDHEGRAWFEADGQLYPFPGDQANSPNSNAPLSGQRLVLAAANRGGLLVAETRSSWLQEGGRMWRFANGQWHAETSRTPPSPSPVSAMVTCLLEDRAGRIWCGTASGGVFFSDSQGRWQRLHPQNSFSQGYISCLFEDRLGNLWVGTVGDGLYRVNLQPVTTFTLPPPFENAEINTTCATRDGCVWMGTGGSGAVKYDGARFTAYGKAEGLTNLHVCALFEDSQTNLWAGTSGGLFRLQAGRFVRVEGPSELSIWVKTLFEDRAGRLWIGTLAGLICFEQGKFTVHYLRPDRRYCDIRCMVEDPAGNLWVGTIGEGLFKLPDGQADQLQRVMSFTAPDARAMYCAPDGTLWIGGCGAAAFS